MSNPRIVDSFGAVSAEIALALKAQGYVSSARYLGAKTHPDWGKGITPQEVRDIHAASLNLVLIWEGSPTSAAYFTLAQAEQDAHEALMEADWLGVSNGTAIYFAVDYDAQPADLGAITEYFAAIKGILGTRYRTGVYGGLRVVQALAVAQVKPAMYWQTSAWSGGTVFEEADLYQHLYDQTVAGLGVDISDVLVPDPGWWPAPQALAPYDPSSAKTLQAILNAALGTHIPETGVMDKATVAAIKSFQVLHHLPVTGTLDATLTDALRKAAQSKTQAVERTAAQDRQQQITKALDLIGQASAIMQRLR